MRTEQKSTKDNHPGIETDPVSFLASIKAFEDLPENVLSELVAAGKLRRVAAGDELFQAGSPYSARIYIHCGGELELVRSTYRIERVELGELLGLSSSLDRSPWSSTAIARTPVTVLVLEEHSLRELQNQYPDLFSAVNRIIAEKLRNRTTVRGVASGILARPVFTAMKSPLSTCTPQCSLKTTFANLRERRIGSLLVMENEEMIGLLTCTGLTEALLLKGARPEDPVARVACETPHTIAADAPLWKAEEQLAHSGVKYLIVMEDGYPIGMLSQTDILRAVTMAQDSVLASVRRAANIQELATRYELLPHLAREALEYNRRPSSAVRMLSEAHLALQRRCVELILESMLDDGHGSPPSPFAFIIMGSGGRREMMLGPDQDNGIIIEDLDPLANPHAREWFRTFSQRINQGLEAIGYPLCPGNIMARNKRFRKTLSEWQAQIDFILTHPNKAGARWSDIMFDFDTLYGDDRLTHLLRRHVMQAVKIHPKLLRIMAENDAEGRPALGLFNRLITTTNSTDGKRIDIKRNGLRIVADAARIFSLMINVPATGTLDRLVALGRLGRLPSDFVVAVGEAFEELLAILLNHQISRMEAGKSPDKLVNPNKLTERERDALRTAMRTVKHFQDRLQDVFDINPF